LSTGYERKSSDRVQPRASGSIVLWPPFWLPDENISCDESWQTLIDVLEHSQSILGGIILARFSMSPSLWFVDASGFINKIQASYCDANGGSCIVRIFINNEFHDVPRELLGSLPEWRDHAEGNHPCSGIKLNFYYTEADDFATWVPKFLRARLQRSEIPQLPLKLFDGNNNICADTNLWSEMAWAVYQFSL